MNRQYDCSITDTDLKGLLLSRRSKRSENGYICCILCQTSLACKRVKGPLRYSIANEFLIGHIPNTVMEESDSTELVSAMIAPTKPFSYALTFQVDL